MSPKKAANSAAKAVTPKYVFFFFFSFISLTVLFCYIEEVALQRQLQLQRSKLMRMRWQRQAQIRENCKYIILTHLLSLMLFFLALRRNLMENKGIFFHSFFFLIFFLR
jgi:hypothetical protein